MIKWKETSQKDLKLV